MNSINHIYIYIYIYIQYHYYRAYPVYNEIRVFVSAYVWMTG